MSLLELKQEVSRLTKSDLQKLFFYLVRLKHHSPEWKRSTAKRIHEMRKGKFLTAEALESRLSRA